MWLFANHLAEAIPNIAMEVEHSMGHYAQIWGMGKGYSVHSSRQWECKQPSMIEWPPRRTSTYHYTGADDAKLHGSKEQRL